jgi:hypothetical protein
MIDFLNRPQPSNFFEPDLNRTGRVVAEREAEQSRFSSIELMRSIARWENEGGAVPQPTA